MSDVSKTSDLIGRLRKLADLADESSHGEGHILGWPRYEGDEFVRNDLRSEDLREAADALEAATRVPVQGEHQHEWDPETSPPRMTCGCDVVKQGEPNDDRADLWDVIDEAYSGLDIPRVPHDTLDGVSAGNITTLRNAILAAGFSRATVPDDAFEEADNRFGEWRGGERHDYADGCYNGFKLGAEWQKARETFISYKSIADEARAERDAALAAIERVRAIHIRSNDWVKRCASCDEMFPCDTIAALDGAPEPEEKP